MTLANISGSLGVSGVSYPTITPGFYSQLLMESKPLSYPFLCICVLKAFILSFVFLSWFAFDSNLHEQCISGVLYDCVQFVFGFISITDFLCRL